jgi:hypothetical protein
MAEPVRARRLSDEEGRRLLQIVRRGKHGSVRVRRAMIIMASASGTLACDDPDRVVPGLRAGEIGVLRVACRAGLLLQAPRAHAPRARSCRHKVTIRVVVRGAGRRLAIAVR